MRQVEQGGRILLQFGFKISIVDFDHPTIRPTDKPEGLTGIRRRTPIRVAPGARGLRGPRGAPRGPDDARARARRTLAARGDGLPG